MVLGEMTPLLLVLWREKHPYGKEQFCSPFNAELPGEITQAAIPFGMKDEVDHAEQRLEFR